MENISLIATVIYMAKSYFTFKNVSACKLRWIFNDLKCIDPS